MERFYNRQTANLQCEVVTPMFLGGANQEAEWRAAPFKSLLRYWWRVTQHGAASPDLLRKDEGSLFGQAGDDDDSGKSLVRVLVVPADTAKSVNRPLDRLEDVRHDECERQQQRVQPLLYLAGMGLAEANGLRVKHSYFPAGASFEIHLDWPGEDVQMKAVGALLQAFGAVGARCRNGWGSFRIQGVLVQPEEAAKILDGLTMDWTLALTRDYPHCLGKDGRGPLLWKTAVRPQWQEAMRDLAQAYIEVRAHEVRTSTGMIGELKPGGGRNNTIQERHLLGIPLTNHGYGGGDARHSSPLRFVVKKQGEGFRGFILHLPHGHSRQQMQGSSVNQQKVWQKVHDKLYALKNMSRATYREVLA
ncbi:MAG: RAMP superfamily CRISPR-associated protein [Candidatus Latescibacterota bacterium]